MKEWNRPELINLALKSTKTDDATELKHYSCMHCGATFKHWKDKVKHENCCPAKKPVNPLPDGNLEDWIVSPS